MQCEIIYMTEGTTGNLGMDRGAMLTQMDVELMSLLQPNTSQKINYIPATPVAMETQIFWSEASFQPLKVERDRLSRTAVVSVFSYEEPGEQ
jgi:hypothetical protein